MPVSAWLDEGAQISAGTDYPIGFYEPIRTVWGMVTRETASAGVQGPEYAVDRYTAVQLSTVAGAQLHGEGDIAGSLQPGNFADVVGFQKDPITCPTDELFDLSPSFTIVGGRPVFDPQGWFDHEQQKS